MAVTDETAKDVLLGDEKGKPVLYDHQGRALVRPIGFRADPPKGKGAGR